uniref:Uncharacterized protein n=1 Tax=Caenorhabditis japonica TaxID=281687 RepID=A0A8R1EFU6_CAEJA
MLSLDSHTLTAMANRHLGAAFDADLCAETSDNDNGLGGLINKKFQLFNHVLTTRYPHLPPRAPLPFIAALVQLIVSRRYGRVASTPVQRTECP